MILNSLGKPYIVVHPVWLFMTELTKWKFLVLCVDYGAVAKQNQFLPSHRIWHVSLIGHDECQNLEIFLDIYLGDAVLIRIYMGHQSDKCVFAACICRHQLFSSAVESVLPVLVLSLVLHKTNMFIAIFSSLWRSSCWRTWCFKIWQGGGGDDVAFCARRGFSQYLNVCSTSVRRF